MFRGEREPRSARLGQLEPRLDERGGQVVGGRAEPSGSDDNIGPSQGLPDALFDALGIVSYHHAVKAVYAKQGQFPSQELRICIKDIAQKEFGADT